MHRNRKESVKQPASRERGGRLQNFGRNIIDIATGKPLAERVIGTELRARDAASGLTLTVTYATDISDIVADNKSANTADSVLLCFGEDSEDIVVEMRHANPVNIYGTRSACRLDLLRDPRNLNYLVAEELDLSAERNTMLLEIIKANAPERVGNPIGVEPHQSSASTRT